MTLQISEITVQLAVGSPAPPMDQPGAARAQTAGSTPLSETQMEQLVARCAQLVMEQLRRDMER
jgi:Family of unknown function (DUF5908)